MRIGHVDVRADRIDPRIGFEDRRQLDAGSGRRERAVVEEPGVELRHLDRLVLRDFARARGSDALERPGVEEILHFGEHEAAPRGAARRDAVVGAVMRDVELALVVVVERGLRSRRERQRRRLVLLNQNPSADVKTKMAWRLMPVRYL